MVNERNEPGGTRHAASVTLGQVLRQVRESAGLSIRQLEATSGVGRMAIQRLESDEVEKPSADHLVHLAQALELNETDLFLLAGVSVPKRTASLDVLLRTEYGLSEAAVVEAKENIRDIIAKYNLGQDGHESKD
ncbi:MAG: helix-turn-helix transcriptional regulator [Pseudonocardiaceae bacterium]